MLHKSILVFPPHTKERTEEGTQQVQSLADKLAGDNKKLMEYWQNTGNAWITNDLARELGISSYVSARVKDLRYLGVDIESQKNGRVTEFRLKRY
jgi:uncharacterized membrane protein